MESDILDRHGLGGAAAARVQHRARLEPLLRKICRRINDNLPAITVSPRDAPHEHHVVPVRCHHVVVVGPSLTPRLFPTPRLADSRTLLSRSPRESPSCPASRRQWTQSCALPVSFAPV